MVKEGVHDLASLMNGFYGGGEHHHQQLQQNDAQETIEQGTARLMAEKNAKQIASRRVSKEERARQEEAVPLVVLDQRHKQRRNRENNLYNSFSLGLKIVRKIWTI